MFPQATDHAVPRRIEDRQLSLTFGQMIARAHLIDVLFVILPHSLLLDIAGAAEAFRLANQHRGRSGLPSRFRLRFAAPNEVQETSVGLAIAGLEPLPEELGPEYMGRGGGSAERAPWPCDSRGPDYCALAQPAPGRVTA